MAVPDKVLLLHPFYAPEETATRNDSDMFCRVCRIWKENTGCEGHSQSVWFRDWFRISLGEAPKCLPKIFRKAASEL